MKRKKKKKSAVQQAPLAAAPEYSVDEILSQFWENYDEAEAGAGDAGPDAEEAGIPAAGAAAGSAGETGAVPGAGPEQAETVSLPSGAADPDAAPGFVPEAEAVTEPASGAADGDNGGEETLWSVRDILEEYRDLEPEWEDATIAPAEGAATAGAHGGNDEVRGEHVAAAAPEAPNEPEEIEDLNFDLPYSLRDIMQEYWGDAGSGDAESAADAGTADDAVQTPQADEAEQDRTPEEDAYPAAEPDDEPLDFSWGALLWGKDADADKAPEAGRPAEEDTGADAPEAASGGPQPGLPETPEAVPEEEAGVPAPEPAGEEDAQPSGKRQKVWEEFPDTPKPSNEPFVDTLDYAALFKMFAEEPASDEQKEAPSGAEASAESTEADEEEGWFAGSGLNPEEVIAAFSDDAEGADRMKAPDAATAAPEPAAPLLAERDGEMDFRDILREFMMGDQHPIYADMPGIGSKAADAQSGEAKDQSPEKDGSPADASAADDGRGDAPEEEFHLPRPRRQYHVEEDFPPEPDDLLTETGPEASDGNALAGTAAAEEKPAEAIPSDRTTAEPEAEEEPEESGLRGRLRTILAGRSLRPSRPRNEKKGLNEPKAFAMREDYIPDEETAVANAAAEAQAARAAELAAKKGGAHAAPDGGLAGDSGESAEANAGEGAWPADADDAAGEDLPDYEADFPSFGQWILNSLMNLWIKLNGVGDRQSTFTMEDEREDPGPEMNVAAASRYYGSQVTMLRMRFQLGLALLAVLAYITLGFPVTGMLKTAKVASAVCLGLQLTILLLCLDVVTNALVNLTRGRFGADGLAVLSCIVTSFDALVVTVGGFGSPHIPLCLFSSLALIGILFSSLLSARALRKSTRVPAIGKRAYCVTAEENVRGGKDITLLKSIRPVAGFVRRSEEAPPDETLFNRFAALALLVVLVLSLLTGIVKHSMRDFLYILSAMLTCAVPFTALTAFALPFFVGSQRIFSSGAAVAGWSGIHDIGCSRNLIVTDRDLFPEETISIDTVRVFADESAERVIAYAGTMIAASGSGLGPSFSDLMEKNGCRMRQVEDFKWLSGGGLQGLIEGHSVLCGSADLMQLMNVKIPYRLVDRTTVLLAIDGVLYGIFKVVYTGLPEIRSALQELIASNRHPIFAIRDFNVTPDMLHEVFDVATDGYDFPPYGDRFRISEAQPSETSKVAAVICREGLGPLTHLADTGRSMYVAVRLNLLVTVLTAVLGTLLVFFRLIGPGILNAWLPFVLMVLDMILVTLITVFMRF